MDMSLLATPFNTGKPHVTPLFVSETLKQPTVGIVVPVILDGKVQYVLGAGLLSQGLSDLLAGSGLPGEWVAAVLDQQGTIIARTQNASEFVGTKAVPEVWRRLQAVKGSSGAIEGPTKEGVAAQLSFARSGASGWMTVVAIPSALLGSDLRTSLLLLGAASTLVLVLCFVFASKASKRISRPAAQLLGMAQALERGENLHPSPTGVDQFDGVAAAMDHAGKTIQDRERSLRDSLDQLRVAHDRLREEQSKKDRFIATLAHELRNPLAPIRTGVQILARSPPAPLAEKTLALMERQMGHITRLLDDLLDVSRIVRGRLELQMKHVDLADVISLAVDAVDPLLKAAGQRLSMQVPDAPVWVNADSPRLTQVLTNVLNNAIKFSPPGETIGLSVRADGAQVEIQVSDAGIGIPPEKLEEVFDAFTQVSEEKLAGHAGGLGIGLSLARMLELHGGSIEARSKGKGQGTTIVLRLPAAPAPAQDHSITPLRATKGGNARRILVVDDNEDAADTIAEALRLSGHSVYVAHDGAKALELAAGMDLDGVVLDIGMPEMDGYEVCRRLRRAERNAGVKIIALTGWNAEADRLRTEEAGFDTHLTKPADLQVLERAFCG
jgi:signal transduction histidine kinase